MTLIHIMDNNHTPTPLRRGVTNWKVDIAKEMAATFRERGDSRCKVIIVVTSGYFMYLDENKQVQTQWITKNTDFSDFITLKEQKEVLRSE